MTLIRNANIVSADEVFLGSVALRGGDFERVAPGRLRSKSGDDWQGDYLLPGLVELHTDNLEKHMMPRPKVIWPALPAIVAHDAQIAASGITTVLDAISIGDIDSDSVRTETLATCVHGLQQAARAGVLRADHFLHIRLELSEQHLLHLFEPFLHDERLKLVSLMDHTPGQRQWTNISHYRVYVGGKRGWSEQKIDAMLGRLQERQQLFAAANRRAIVERCMRRVEPVPLAAHDDTTLEHVQQGLREGVTISEFPTTLQAAHAARERGMRIVMGAPNLVRGGSHSGNVAAAELARAGLLDVLSSDYVPASLLHAAFLLRREGFSLPQAVATVSRNPALLVGLADRGEVAPELRADFLRVRVIGEVPVVLGVWKAGRQIC